MLSGRAVEVVLIMAAGENESVCGRCTRLSAEDVQQLLNDAATIQIILMEFDYSLLTKTSPTSGGETLVSEKGEGGEAAAMQVAMVQMEKVIGMLETLGADPTTMAARCNFLPLPSNPRVNSSTMSAH